MPHTIGSARTTVLEPKGQDEATPIRNPVTHVHIVALIAGFILLLLAAIALIVT